MKRIFRIFLLLISFVVFSGLTACDKDDDKGKTEQNENGGNQNGSDENNGDNNDGNQNGDDENKLSVSGSIGNHDYVDLGLPSGTLWATCNVGATKPEEYGNHYAWGETETKDI